MPTCCVTHCASRTDRIRTRNIKYFTFPKEKNIQQKWLDICQKSKQDIKVNSARVCGMHFMEDDFEEQWTKPRTKNENAKPIRRLKKGSVPTQCLHLNNERKEKLPDTSNSAESKSMECQTEKMKVLANTGIPTYTELIHYAKSKQNTVKVQTSLRNLTSMIDSIKHVAPQVLHNIHYDASPQRDSKKTIDATNKEENILNLNSTIQENICGAANCHLQVTVNTLLELLKESEEEKKKLVEERNKFATISKQLYGQVQELQTSVQNKSFTIEKMAANRYKEAQKIACDILRKIFTPG